MLTGFGECTCFCICCAIHVFKCLIGKHMHLQNCKEVCTHVCSVSSPLEVCMCVHKWNAVRT